MEVEAIYAAMANAKRLTVGGGQARVPIGAINEALRQHAPSEGSVVSFLHFMEGEAC